MSHHYNSNNIRQLLTEGFSIQELLDLCFDEPKFQDLHNLIPKNANKNQIVSSLLEFARQRSCVDTILTWARANNPQRYQQHAPYLAKGLSTTSTEASPQSIIDLNPDDWSKKHTKKGLFKSFLSYLFDDPT